MMLAALGFSQVPTFKATSWFCHVFVSQFDCKPEALLGSPTPDVLNPGQSVPFHLKSMWQFSIGLEQTGEGLSSPGVQHNFGS